LARRTTLPTPEQSGVPVQVSEVRHARSACRSRSVPSDGLELGVLVGAGGRVVPVEELLERVWRAEKGLAGQLREVVVASVW
jgi:hypothetical protein